MGYLNVGQVSTDEQALYTEHTEEPVYVDKVRDVGHHVEKVGGVLDRRRVVIEDVLKILRENGTVAVRNFGYELCGLLRIAANTNLH